MFEPVLKGIALGLLLSISVGPVVFSILKQSINNGHRGGYAFIAGVSASDISLVVVCNVFTRLFNKAMHHELWIGIAGSILLVGMGLYNIFLRKVKTTDSGTHAVSRLSAKDLVTIFFSGYFMNSLNPGALLFWLGATATISADALSRNHPDQYRLAVFVTCLALVFSFDFIKVLLANKIREKLTPKNIHIVNRLSGIILIGFGIAIIITMVLHNGAKS